MAWCDLCGKRIDWFQLVETGKKIPVDPDPAPVQAGVSGARYVFRNARLTRARPDDGADKKRYADHRDGCARTMPTLRRAAFICDRDECEIDGRHLHCFECGAIDHLAQDCPDGA